MSAAASISSLAVVAPALLELDEVSVLFHVHGATLTAVDAVSLRVATRDSVGLVGESGCGKTTVARCIVGLQRPQSGTVRLNEQPLGLRRSPEQRRAIQIVFQDPFSSLNPRLSVRKVLRELLSVHDLVPPSGSESRCRELMELVGLSASTLDGYPGGFSGGQRQRIAIARALAVEPRILVADEPTSALDVSVQAAVLDLFERVRAGLGVGVLFISHNLAAVRHLCERVAVMYLGRIVETGTREQIFSAAAHPYTRALLEAAPRMRAAASAAPGLRAEAPSPTRRPSGCAFHQRCPRAEELCARESPRLEPVEGAPDQLAACHFRDERGPVSGR
jgi:oligopeptide/dipeptide ABC transporter ATP-binding protein